MNTNSIKPSHCLTTHNKCKIEEKKKKNQSASVFLYKEISINVISILYM